MKFQDKYDLSGLLGMTEMQIAVGVMLERCPNPEQDFHSIRVHPHDFVGIEMRLSGDACNWALTGFVHLVARDLMIPDYPNSTFVPGKRLIELLNERFGWSLPNSPTMSEYLAKTLESCGVKT